MNAPKTDAPINLSYKSFFYNACNTGTDYIENFRQSDFIFTHKRCWVHQATKIFVMGVVEGKSTEQIMPLLNAPNVGGGAGEGLIYDFKRF